MPAIAELHGDVQHRDLARQRSGHVFRAASGAGSCRRTIWAAAHARQLGGELHRIDADQLCSSYSRASRPSSAWASACRHSSG